MYILHSTIKSKIDPKMVGLRIEGVQVTEDLAIKMRDSLLPLPDQIEGEPIEGHRGITKIDRDIKIGSRVFIVHYIGRDSGGIPRSMKIIDAFDNGDRASDFVREKEAEIKISLDLDRLWFGITECRVGERL